jgi:hypothetical protein
LTPNFSRIRNSPNKLADWALVPTLQFVTFEEVRTPCALPAQAVFLVRVEVAFAVVAEEAEIEAAIYMDRNRALYPRTGVRNFQ